MISQFKIFLWKEWLAQRSFAVLLIVFYLLMYIWYICSNYFDEYSTSIYTGSSGLGYINVVFMYIGCIALFTKDKDEKTQLFTKGLPSSKLVCFITKSIMPITIYLIFFLITLGMTFGQAMFVIGIETIWSNADYIFKLILLHSLQIIFLGVLFGFFSFFRHWGIMILVFLTLLFNNLKDIGLPYLDYLNLFSLADGPENYGDSWDVPWKKITCWTIISIALWVVSFFIYAKAGVAGFKWTRKLNGSVWGKVLTTVMIIVLLVMLVLVIKTTDKKDKEFDEDESLRFVINQKKIVKKETKYFDFAIHKRNQNRFEKLKPEWDKTHDKLAKYLKLPVEYHDTRITVDACNPLMSHAAGQANSSWV